MKHITPYLLAGLLLYQVEAQKKGQWNWPKDRATAEEKKVLYEDNIENKNYIEAVEPLEWLLENVPNLNPSIYIHGVKVYTELAKQTLDSATQVRYRKKVLHLFDTRVQYFGDEGKVINRKALTAYKFYKQDPRQYKELIALFEKSIALNQEKIIPMSLLGLMDIVHRHHKKNKQLTKEEIIDYYLLVLDVLERMQAKISEEVSSEKLEKKQERLRYIGENIDKLFGSTVTVDCQFVNTVMGTRLENNPGDVKMAKKTLALLVKKDCKNNALFLRTAKLIFASEPSLMIARSIASKSADNKNYTTALEFYEKAYPYALSNAEKADLHLGTAKIYASMGDKNKARSAAKKAIRLAVSKSSKDAYKFIGWLYLTSYAECSKAESRVQDKAVYLAAYDMFEKGGHKKLMKSCEGQFPTIEEIFEEGRAENEKIHVNCWVQEDTILRRAIRSEE